MAGRASGQNCSRAPVKVLPSYLSNLAGTCEPLNKEVNDVIFGHQRHFQHVAINVHKLHFCAFIHGNHQYSNVVRFAVTIRQSITEQ